MAIIQVTISGHEAFPAAAGLSVGEALKQFGVAGDHDVVAARVNGNLVDLNASLLDDSTITPVSQESPEGLDIVRHSAAHIMAEAVRSLFPESRLPSARPSKPAFIMISTRPSLLPPRTLSASRPGCRSWSNRTCPSAAGMSPGRRRWISFQARVRSINWNCSRTFGISRSV